MFVPSHKLPFGCPGWVCVCVSVPRSDSRGQVTLLTLPPPVYHASPTCSHTHASYICKWSGLLKLPPALTSATLHLVRIWNCFGDWVLDTHNTHDLSLVIRDHLPLIFPQMTSKRTSLAWIQAVVLYLYTWTVGTWSPWIHCNYDSLYSVSGGHVRVNPLLSYLSTLEQWVVWFLAGHHLLLHTRWEVRAGPMWTVRLPLLK